MPRYIVLQKSFINDQLHNPGDIIEYDPPVGLDDEGKKVPTKVGANLKLTSSVSLSQAEAELVKAQADLAAATA